jgi:hypothetical protein
MNAEDVLGDMQETCVQEKRIGWHAGEVLDDTQGKWSILFKAELDSW